MAISVVKTITATVGVSAAYSDGDQMGPVIVITDALRSSSGSGMIDSIVLLDKALQKSAIDVLFFNASPTLTSTDNNKLDIADSEMASKLIGRVSVPAASYVDLNANSDVTVKGIGLRVAGYLTANLYVVLQCKGTPTYGSATDLVLKIGITQE